MLWKDKYELHVPLIDSQHRDLFARVDMFLKTLRAPVSWEEKEAKVNETLDFMSQYVVVHFHDEESYQREIGYPGLENHQKLHTQLVCYVVQVKTQYEAEGCNEVVMQQLAGKLLAWLINHVASEDQKIASYAIEKGVAHYGH
jgi:hemerythrin